jgi:hypothetical protein
VPRLESLRAFFKLIIVLYWLGLSVVHAQGDSGSGAFLTPAKLVSMAYSPEWSALLQVTPNGKTRIDDEDFFAAGLPVDLLKELLFTIENASPGYVCRFPARYSFIAKELGVNLSTSHCEELTAFLSHFEGSTASLIFASSYTGSPASYFGHTILRFNKPKNLFFSPTIGFAADVPDDIGFWSLMVRGGFGRLNGQYVVAPFYQVAEKYLVLEQRSLVEYRLNLSPDEIRRLLLYAYELAGAEIDYNFFTANCTTELIPLLRVARPSLPNDSRFLGVLLPADAISQLEEGEVVSQITHNTALAESLYEAYRTLPFESRRAFRRLNRSKDKPEYLRQLAEQTDDIDILADLVAGRYAILFKRQQRPPDDFAAVQSIRHAPVTRPNVLYTGRLNYPLYTGFYTHASTTSLQEAGIVFRPALFSRFDTETSSLGESSLEFLQTTLGYNMETVRLRELTLFRIEAFTRWTPFTPVPSWRLEAGLQRSITNENLHALLEVGTGVSIGPPRLLLTVMPEVYGTTQGPSGGVRLRSAASLRLGLFRLGHDVEIPLWNPGGVDDIESMSRLDAIFVNRLHIGIGYDSMRSLFSVSSGLYY